MTIKQIRIMFYDEDQRQWVVDTMEVANENDDIEKSEHESGHESDPSDAHVMSYV